MISGGKYPVARELALNLGGPTGKRARCGEGSTLRCAAHFVVFISRRRQTHVVEPDNADRTSPACPCTKSDAETQKNPPNCGFRCVFWTPPDVLKQCIGAQEGQAKPHSVAVRGGSCAIRVQLFQVARKLTIVSPAAGPKPKRRSA